MATEYLTFFNLNDDPFHLTPDTAYFYNSPEHTTALLSLEYAVTHKEGFCLLTGEPGTGKTTILRLFTEKWKERAEIALVMTPRLLPDEFFQAILDDFKIPLNDSKNEMLKSFRSFLLANAADDRRVAIIVDEAQELPESTLEELRLLSNMETEKEKLLQIILIGQPELRSKLLCDSLRQLNQRISVRVQLDPLTAPETSDYINTRLIKGGNSSLLYEQKAKELIFTMSGGVPRTINLLASRGLMSAFLDESKIVMEKHIQVGARDVMEPLASGSTRSTHPGKQRLKGAPDGTSVSSNPGECSGGLVKLFARIKNIFGGNRSHASQTSQPSQPSQPSQTSQTSQTSQATQATQATQASQTSQKTDTHPADLLELEVGPELLPMLNAEKDGDLFDRIRFIRQQASKKMGIEVPPIRILENSVLKACEYTLSIQGVKAGGCELADKYLAMDSGSVTESMNGILAEDPIFGFPAVWIGGELREEAEMKGYTVVDSTTVIATHINEMIKKYSLELFYRQGRE